MWNFEEILTRQRHCRADWLIRQAETLARFAKEKASHNALVYGAVEARNAIEQLMFEMIVVAKGNGGTLDKATYDRCKKKDGTFDVLKEVEPDYRKLVQFTNIGLSLNRGAPNVSEWEIKKLKRYFHELSEFCHFQGDPAQTVASTMNSWLGRGVAKIEEVFEYFKGNMAKNSGTGVFAKSSMPQEVLNVWEDFRTDKIDAATVRLRLKLMQPALDQRRSMAN